MFEKLKTGGKNASERLNSIWLTWLNNNFNVLLFFGLFYFKAFDSFSPFDAVSMRFCSRKTFYPLFLFSKRMSVIAIISEMNPKNQWLSNIKYLLKDNYYMPFLIYVKNVKLVRRIRWRNRNTYQ